MDKLVDATGLQKFAGHVFGCCVFGVILGSVAGAGRFDSLLNTVKQSLPGPWFGMGRSLPTRDIAVGCHSLGIAV